MPTAVSVTAATVACAAIGGPALPDRIWFSAEPPRAGMYSPVTGWLARWRPRRLMTTGTTGTSAAAVRRPIVVVGVDGSPESRRVLTDVDRLFADTQPVVVLVAVVGHDATGRPDQIDRARRLLDRCADQLSDRLFELETEIAAGPPAKALLELADARGADVIAVGRRGRGMSTRLLGSVADHVVRHSVRPVLLGGHPADAG